VFTITEKATQYPFACALTGTEKGPFIDTGVVLDAAGPYDRHIYISVETVKELAQVAGVGPSAAEIERQLQARENFGRFEAVKEGLGPDVRRIAASLGDIARALVDERDGVAPVGEPSPLE